MEGVGGCLGVWPLLDGWFRGLSATTRCVANWKVEFVPRRMRSTEAVRTLVYSVHGALLDIEQLYNIVTSSSYVALHTKRNRQGSLFITDYSYAI